MWRPPSRGGRHVQMCVRLGHGGTKRGAESAMHACRQGRALALPVLCVLPLRSGPRNPIGHDFEVVSRRGGQQRCLTPLPSANPQWARFKCNTLAIGAPVLFCAVPAVNVRSSNVGRALALTPTLHTMAEGESGSVEGLGCEGPPDSANAIRPQRPTRRRTGSVAEVEGWLCWKVGLCPRFARA